MPTKCWMLRHQAAGHVVSAVFSSEPTQAQLAPLVLEIESRHGKGGAFWLHEAELFGPGESPLVMSGAAPQPFVPSGVGTVS